MRTIATLVFSLVFSSLCLAQTGNPSSAGAISPEPYYVATPDQLIRQGVNRLTGFLMGVENASPEAVREFVELELAGFFDFDYMSRWAAGPFYRRLNDAQKSAMTARMKDMFLGAVAKHLGSQQLPLSRVEVYPARPGRTANESNVLAQVFTNNSRTQMNFRFYWSQTGWKVFDVSANGASAVAFYRRFFNNLFRRYGPDAVLR
jgi:phospholipid transport system substrate-binding protein